MHCFKSGNSDLNNLNYGCLFQVGILNVLELATPPDWHYKYHLKQSCVVKWNLQTTISFWTRIFLRFDFLLGIFNVNVVFSLVQNETMLFNVFKFVMRCSH